MICPNCSSSQENGTYCSQCGTRIDAPGGAAPFFSVYTVVYMVLAVLLFVYACLHFWS